MRSYRGESVAPGVAMGRVHLQGYDDAVGYVPRIPSDQVEHELNALRDALQRSREQIEQIRARQEGKLPADELRIFDAHLAYLQDPLFVDEIERQILTERHPVRGAIGKVVGDYDRLFSLVESEHLRQRAGDLRDVGTRILRNLGDAPEQVRRASRPEGRYVLAAARLTTTDMFDLENDQIDGIVAEEGGISSHAAILARSMGIPTITGIRDLPAKLENGATVVVDATAGELVVDPDEALLERYRKAVSAFRSARIGTPPAEGEHATRDGTEVRILASCGNAGEVDLARTWGLDGIGLFRTELMFLGESRLPTEDELVEHYEAVVGSADEAVSFRLLDVSGVAPIPGTQTADERNPALGIRGVRRLLRDPDVLRLQLRAILRAARGHDRAAILVPFVTAVTDLAQVRQTVVEERLALRKRKVRCADTLLLAPIIEVPAAAFTLPMLLADSDFAVVALDDLRAHLLGADRDSLAVRRYYEMVHPATFELLDRMAKNAIDAEKRLVVFGESAADPRWLPFFLGIGIRDVSVAPVRLKGVLKTLQRFTIDECRKIAESVLQAPRALDVERILVQLGE